MCVGRRIRKARKSKDWTLEDLKKKTGMSISFLSDIERGVSNPSLKRLKQIARALNVSISYLLNEHDPSKTITVPEIYSIRQENNLWAESNVKEYHFVEKEKVNNGLYFFIRARDDSMLGSGILPGSLVLVRKQSEIRNGDIAIILLKGKENTDFIFRKIFKTEGQWLLQPDNSRYETLIIPKEDLKVAGKVISLVHNFE
jgi:repressor LexA